MSEGVSSFAMSVTNRERMYWIEGCMGNNGRWDVNPAPPQGIHILRKYSILAIDVMLLVQ